MRVFSKPSLGIEMLPQMFADHCQSYGNDYAGLQFVEQACGLLSVGRSRLNKNNAVAVAVAHSHLGNQREKFA